MAQSEQESQDGASLKGRKCHQALLTSEELLLNAYRHSAYSEVQESPPQRWFSHIECYSGSGCYGFRNNSGAKEDWKHTFKTDLLRTIKSTNNLCLWKSPRSWESTQESITEAGPLLDPPLVTTHSCGCKTRSWARERPLF